jgi:hypothetical protein
VFGTLKPLMAKAQAIERSLKLNDDGANASAGLPVAVVARQVTDKDKPRPTPAAVTDFVRAVTNCGSTESFAKLLDTYSRNVCQKPVNVEKVLLCQEDKEIDLIAE